jgi:hypothetical protein
MLASCFSLTQPNGSADTAPQLGSETLGSETEVVETAKLGWILIRNHWVSASQLQTALNQQSHANSHISPAQPKLGELLLQAALISETQLQQALREQYWRRHGYWVI